MAEIAQWSLDTTHLQKLDRIQAAAEKLGGFKLESLESRRDASLIGLLFKLLDGEGRGKLNEFKPMIENLNPTRKGRHTATGLQLKDQTNTKALLGFERSIVGRAHKVWERGALLAEHTKFGRNYLKN